MYLLFFLIAIILVEQKFCFKEGVASRTFWIFSGSIGASRCYFWIYTNLIPRNKIWSQITIISFRRSGTTVGSEFLSPDFVRNRKKNIVFTLFSTFKIYIHIYIYIIIFCIFGIPNFFLRGNTENQDFKNSNCRIILFIHIYFGITRRLN